MLGGGRGAQRETGQPARVPPAGEVAPLQLCCVSDWLRRALGPTAVQGRLPRSASSAQSETATAPLCRTSAQLDSALPSHLHPGQTLS